MSSVGSVGRTVARDDEGPNEHNFFEGGRHFRESHLLIRKSPPLHCKMILPFLFAKVAVMIYIAIVILRPQDYFFPHFLAIDDAVNEMHVSKCYVLISSCTAPGFAPLASSILAFETVKRNGRFVDIDGSQTLRCVQTVCVPPNRTVPLLIRLRESILVFGDVNAWVNTTTPAASELATPLGPLVPIGYRIDVETDASVTNPALNINKVYFQNGVFNTIRVNITQGVVAMVNTITPSADITVGWGPFLYESSFDRSFSISGMILNATYCVSPKLTTFSSEPCTEVSCPVYASFSSTLAAGKSTTSTTTAAPTGAESIDVSVSYIKVNASSLYVDDHTVANFNETVMNVVSNGTTTTSAPHAGWENATVIVANDDRFAGSGMFVDPDISFWAATALDDSKKWIADAKFDVYVQALDIITPGLGMVIKESNIKTLIEIGPEWVSFFSAFVLRPTYRKLFSALSHYQCPSNTARVFTNPSTVNNIIAINSHPSLSREQSKVLLEQWVGVDMQFRMTRRMDEYLPYEPAIFVVSTPAGDWSPSTPFTIADWPDYTITKQGDGTVTTQRLTMSGISIAIVSLSTLTAAFLTIFGLMLMATFKHPVTSSFYLIPARAALRACVNFASAIHYSRYESMAAFMSWVSFRITKYITAALGRQSERFFVGSSMNAFLDQYFTKVDAAAEMIKNAAGGGGDDDRRADLSEKMITVSSLFSKFEMWSLLKLTDNKQQDKNEMFEMVSKFGGHVTARPVRMVTGLRSLVSRSGANNDDVEDAVEEAAGAIAKKAVSVSKNGHSSGSGHSSGKSAAGGESGFGFGSMAQLFTVNVQRAAHAAAAVVGGAAGSDPSGSRRPFALDEASLSAWYQLTGNPNDMVEFDEIFVSASVHDRSLTAEFALKKLGQLGLSVVNVTSDVILGIEPKHTTPKGLLLGEACLEMVKELEFMFASFPSLALMETFTSPSVNRFRVIFWAIIESLIFTIMIITPFAIAFVVTLALDFDHALYSTSTNLLTPFEMYEDLVNFTAPIPRNMLTIVTLCIGAGCIALTLVEIIIVLFPVGSWSNGSFMKPRLPSDTSFERNQDPSLPPVTRGNLVVRSVQRGWIYFRSSITLIIHVGYTILVLFIVWYFFTVSIWWILGTIVAPEKMLVFATSIVTFFTLIFQQLRNLMAMRDTVKDRAQEAILKAILKLVKETPLGRDAQRLVNKANSFQGGPDVKDPASFGLPGTAGLIGVPPELLIQASGTDIDTSEAAIEKIAIALQLPPEGVGMVLCLLHKQPKRIQLTVRRLCTSLRLPPQLHSITEQLTMIAFGFPVAPAEIAHAFYDFSPDHEDILQKFDPTVVAIISAIVEPGNSTDGILNAIGSGLDAGLTDSIEIPSGALHHLFLAGHHAQMQRIQPMLHEVLKFLVKAICCLPKSPLSIRYMVDVLLQGLRMVNGLSHTLERSIVDFMRSMLKIVPAPKSAPHLDLPKEDGAHPEVEVDPTNIDMTNLQPGMSMFGDYEPLVQQLFAFMDGGASDAVGKGKAAVGVASGLPKESPTSRRFGQMSASMRAGAEDEIEMMVMNAGGPGAEAAFMSPEELAEERLRQMASMLCKRALGMISEKSTAIGDGNRWTVELFALMRCELTTSSPLLSAGIRAGVFRPKPKPKDIYREAFQWFQDPSKLTAVSSKVDSTGHPLARWLLDQWIVLQSVSKFQLATLPPPICSYTVLSQQLDIPEGILSMFRDRLSVVSSILLLIVPQNIQLDLQRLLNKLQSRGVEHVVDFVCMMENPDVAETLLRSWNLIHTILVGMMKDFNTPEHDDLAEVSVKWLLHKIEEANNKVQMVNAGSFRGVDLRAATGDAGLSGPTEDAWDSLKSVLKRGITSVTTFQLDPLFFIWGMPYYIDSVLRAESLHAATLSANVSVGLKASRRANGLKSFLEGGDFSECRPFPLEVGKQFVVIGQGYLEQMQGITMENPIIPSVKEMSMIFIKYQRLPSMIKDLIPAEQTEFITLWVEALVDPKSVEIDNFSKLLKISPLIFIAIFKPEIFLRKAMAGDAAQALGNILLRVTNSLLSLRGSDNHAKAAEGLFKRGTNNDANASVLFLNALSQLLRLYGIRKHEFNELKEWMTWVVSLQDSRRAGGTTESNLIELMHRLRQHSGLLPRSMLEWYQGVGIFKAERLKNMYLKALESRSKVTSMVRTLWSVYREDLCKCSLPIIDPKESSMFGLGKKGSGAMPPDAEMLKNVVRMLMEEYDVSSTSSGDESTPGNTTINMLRPPTNTNNFFEDDDVVAKGNTAAGGGSAGNVVAAAERVVGGALKPPIIEFVVHVALSGRLMIKFNPTECSYCQQLKPREERVTLLPCGHPELCATCKDATPTINFCPICVAWALRPFGVQEAEVLEMCAHLIPIYRIWKYIFHRMLQCCRILSCCRMLSSEAALASRLTATGLGDSISSLDSYSGFLNGSAGNMGPAGGHAPHASINHHSSNTTHHNTATPGATTAPAWAPKNPEHELLKATMREWMELLRQHCPLMYEKIRLRVFIRSKLRYRMGEDDATCADVDDADDVITAEMHEIKVIVEECRWNPILAAFHENVPPVPGFSFYVNAPTVAATVAGMDDDDDDNVPLAVRSSTPMKTPSKSAGKTAASTTTTQKLEAYSNKPNWVRNLIFLRSRFMHGLFVKAKTISPALTKLYEMDLPLDKSVFAVHDLKWAAFQRMSPFPLLHPDLAPARHFFAALSGTVCWFPEVNRIVFALLSLILHRQDVPRRVMDVLLTALPPAQRALFNELWIFWTNRSDESAAGFPILSGAFGLSPLNLKEVLAWFSAPDSLSYGVVGKLNAGSPLSLDPTSTLLRSLALGQEMFGLLRCCLQGDLVSLLRFRHLFLIERRAPTTSGLSGAFGGGGGRDVDHGESTGLAMPSGYDFATQLLIGLIDKVLHHAAVATAAYQRRVSGANGGKLHHPVVVGDMMAMLTAIKSRLGFDKDIVESLKKALPKSWSQSFTKMASQFGNTKKYIPLVTGMLHMIHAEYDHGRRDLVQFVSDRLVDGKHVAPQPPSGRTPLFNGQKGKAAAVTLKAMSHQHAMAQASVSLLSLALRISMESGPGANDMAAVADAVCHLVEASGAFLKCIIDSSVEPLAQHSYIKRLHLYDHMVLPYLRAWVLPRIRSTFAVSTSGSMKASSAAAASLMSGLAQLAAGEESLVHRNEGEENVEHDDDDDAEPASPIDVKSVWRNNAELAAALEDTLDDSEWLIPTVPDMVPAAAGLISLLTSANTFEVIHDLQDVLLRLIQVGLQSHSIVQFSHGLTLPDYMELLINIQNALYKLDVRMNDLMSEKFGEPDALGMSVLPSLTESASFTESVTHVLDMGELPGMMSSSETTEDDEEENDNAKAPLLGKPDVKGGKKIDVKPPPQGLLKDKTTKAVSGAKKNVSLIEPEPDNDPDSIANASKSAAGLSQLLTIRGKEVTDDQIKKFLRLANDLSSEIRLAMGNVQGPMLLMVVLNTVIDMIRRGDPAGLTAAQKRRGGRTPPTYLLKIQTLIMLAQGELDAIPILFLYLGVQLTSHTRNVLQDALNMTDTLKRLSTRTSFISSNELFDVVSEQIFNIFDRRKVGRLTFEDVRLALLRMRLISTEAEYKQWFLDFDGDGDGEITLDEFRSELRKSRTKIETMILTKMQLSYEMIYVALFWLALTAALLIGFLITGVYGFAKGDQFTAMICGMMPPIAAGLHQLQNPNGMAAIMKEVDTAVCNVFNLALL